MLGLYDGFFLSGASKTSVLTERIWVTDSLCHHCILFYFLLLVEWRGGGERIVRVLGLEWSRTLILYGIGSMM